MKQVKVYAISILTIGTLVALPSVSFALPDLMNVWHIPTNEEPPTVTMRNPVHPTSSDPSVYFYLGGWPSDQIGTAEIYYRLNDENWLSLSLVYDSTQGNGNVYYIVHIDGPFTDGTVVSYYFKAVKTGYDTTFVYGDDGSTNTTATEADAQAAPFTFIFGSGATPTPTPTQQFSPGPTQTITATPTPTPDSHTSPTPTPSSVDVIVEISTNDSYYSAGSWFALRSDIMNQGQEINVNHYILLNIGDGYWFWPSWRSDPPDYKPRTLLTRHSYTDYILQFVWPEGVGAIDSIIFLIAVQDAGSSAFLTWAQCECSAD